MLKVQTLNSEDAGPVLGSTSLANAIRMGKNWQQVELKHDQGEVKKNDTGFTGTALRIISSHHEKLMLSTFQHKILLNTSKT
jgi:hypothetical protein